MEPKGKSIRVKKALGKLKDLLINKKVTVGLEDNHSFPLTLFNKTKNENGQQVYHTDQDKILLFE